MAALLSYYYAASGDLLSCLPLQLTLRGKSTTQSYRTPIYYVDLTLRDGVNLNDAITSAKQMDVQSKASGFYQEALNHVVRQGYGNASFEVGVKRVWLLLRSFIRMNPNKNHLSHHMT